MNNWELKKLSELGTVVGGATPSTKNEEYYNGEIPWITPKDLSSFSGRYIKRGERNITQLGFENCSTYLMPPKSILFTSRAPIGYIAISSNEICTNQGFKSIIPHENTDYLFLYYLLKYNKEKIESMGSGTTFKEVSGNVMKNIEVCVPSDKFEQEKIASILNCLDEKIELNNKINDNLEQMAQAIFKSWFIDFEPWGGTIPEDWREGSIYALMDVIYGAPFKSTLFNSDKNGYPLIRIRDLKTFLPQLYTPEVLPKMTIVKAGDVLVGMDAEFRPCIWQGETGVLNQRVCKIVPKRSISRFYVYATLKPYLEFIEFYKTGTTVSHIGKADFDKIQITIPSETVLNDFSKLIEPLYLQILNNSDENSRLVILRDNLLPRLMSGELSVADI